MEEEGGNFYGANVLESNFQLSGAPRTGVGKSHGQGTMTNSSTNDRMHINE